MNFNLPTKFVNPPSRSLLCPLCQRLFSNPVISTQCGHTFCLQCVIKCSEAGNGICPIDERPVSRSGIVPNHAVEGQLEDLPIYCQHGLYRADSEEDFQIDADGCKEIITLGHRHEHESHCLHAWIPCPNSSNFCGKFRKHNFEDHLMVCKHTPCRNKERGCQFIGTNEEIMNHLHKCKYATDVIEWDVLEQLEDENSGDGLQAKYLVKAVRNLNDRVMSLENGKDEVLSKVEQCNSAMVKLSVQVEKLMLSVDQIRITQNALMHGRVGSVTDIAALSDYRRTVSTFGLNTYSSSRTRSSSSGPSHLFSFSERRLETWKMPLSFKCVGTFRSVNSNPESLRGHNGIIRAVVSKGPYIFSGGSDHCIKVWDIKDKDMKNSRGCIATLREHTGDIHALCTCGGFLYSAGTDKSIKVWNIDEYQLHASREDAHSDIIGALVTTGKYVFSGSYSSIKIWRVLTLELLHTISNIHHWVRAFAVDSKKKTVYSGSHNAVHIWTAEEPFASQGNLSHSHGSVYSLAVTDKYLILGTYNQNTHLYDVRTHDYVKVLNGHLGIITHLTPSPSGNFLFTASHDKTVQVSLLTSTASDESRYMSGLESSWTLPEKWPILSINKNLWDLIKLLPVQVLSRHEGGVTCMALRGDMLFTGSEDKEIKVFMYYQGLASKNLMVV